MTVVIVGNKANRGPDARDYEIGWANSDNVSQLLYSLALYPFTQFSGYVGEN